MVPKSKYLLPRPGRGIGRLFWVEDTIAIGAHMMYSSGSPVLQRSVDLWSNAWGSSLKLLTIYTSPPSPLPFTPGLPLPYAIEGPSNDSDVIFVIGARPITNGFDFNFGGVLGDLIASPSTAPPFFSLCVLDCLESLTVDVSGTQLTVTPFNVSTRQLRLVGPASPAQVQQVLRGAVYLNRAPNINVESIQLEVCNHLISLVQPCTSLKARVSSSEGGGGSFPQFG